MEKNLIDIIAKSGIVGAGGAGFPTHVKMNAQAEYVIINGAECEPFITGDYRLMIEQADELITAVTYVKENLEYVIRIYIHNNAASNLDLTAHDVRASIMLPNEYARKISVGCKISCPDADPKGVWDGTNFYSDDERSFALTYVEDSLRYYNNAGTFRLQDETQGDYSAFTNKGVLLGFDEMDGVIPGCMQYSGYITFHVKPIFQN